MPLGAAHPSEEGVHLGGGYEGEGLAILAARPWGGIPQQGEGLGIQGGL